VCSSDLINKRMLLAGDKRMKKKELSRGRKLAIFPAL